MQGYFIIYILQIGICLVPDEFRTVPKIPRFGDFKGQSLEFPLTQIAIYLIILYILLYNYIVMKKLIVNKKYDGKKLNTFLLDSFDGLSLNTIYKALRKKDIRVNNVKVSENVTIHSNDEITVFINDNFLFKNFDLDIVYEDSNILIVNKPVELEVVSNNSEKTLTSI